MATTAPPVLTSASSYSSLSIWLHWIIAVMVLGNIAGALAADGVDKETAGQIMAIHKANGLTVLVLSLVRLAARLAHGTAPLKPTLAGWERSLARLVHTLFYALMILVPLLGWAMASAGPKPLTWFGLFDWPKLPVAPKSTLAGLAHDGHELLGLSFLGLAVLHVAGALKHQFLDGDRELARMLPFLGSPDPADRRR